MKFRLNIKNEPFAFVLFVVATVVTIGLIFGYQQLRMVKVHPIVIETHAPERGNFQPSLVVIPAHEPVVLELRNPEAVSHGFAVPSLHVGIQEIKAGHVERIELPELAPGVHEFFCSTWCTENHMKMRGKIVVKEGLQKGGDKS